MLQFVVALYGILAGNLMYGELQLEDPDDNDDQDDVEEQENNDVNKLWTRDAVLFLIHQMETYETKFETGLKKNVYKTIAANCTKHFGKPVVYSQIGSKWKSLKRTYKSILLHTKTSGKGRQTSWEFFNVMHELMFKKPEITPAATCSSRKGVVVNNEAPTTPGTSESCETNSDNGNTETFRSSFAKKRKSRLTEAQKRHEDKMARLDKFNELFADMVEQMKK